MRFCLNILLTGALCLLLLGCTGGDAISVEDLPKSSGNVQSEYAIGPGDTLQIFVWENPDVSVTIPVRPDGRISTPLIEDMQAVGKTPTQLARDLEVALAEYIRSPTVNVIVTDFVGMYGMQVRVVGQALSPQAIPYKEDMTLLDVMIAVGGLSENAAGNRAKIIRQQGNQKIEIKAKVKDLLNDGDISANVKMMPGDILIIPESWL